MIAPGSDGTARGRSRSSATRERIRAARVHPIAVLAALRTYALGPRCCAARGTWTPVAQVVDALDAAFYAAFGNVEPAGKRTAARARRVGIDDLGRRSPACRA